MTERSPRPPAAAARTLTRALAQARFDARVMLRNGEQLLLTLVLPALLLVATSRFAVPGLTSSPTGRRIDLVAPGVLALAVMSAAFTGQAIATGFDRRHGVLRMLATTPLGRGGLLAGRTLAVLVVEAVQVAVLGAIALALGWRPHWSGLAWALLLVAGGTAAFVALGLLLAGTLRAEAVLAGANLAWVLLLAGGGVMVPTERMGAWGTPARLLPSGALGDGMRAALLDGRADPVAIVVLLAWTAVAAAMAMRYFRWE
jgi:ABC-2 type transport system permease protein